MNTKLLSFMYKIAFVLLLIALVTIYNYFTDRAKVITDDTKVPSIDYYATNIKVSQYKENGGIDYKISADRMTHIQQTDVAYLTNPTADLYKNSQNPWLIRSNNGEIGPKGETVKLINNIEGTQVDDQGKTNTFKIGQQKNKQDPMKYGELMIYPDQKRAESKDFTLVTSDDGYSSGVGIEAFFETNKIKFLSDVKTYLDRGKHATN